MNEQENQAMEFLKHSLYEYEEIDTSVLEYIDKNHKIIYKLILKQHKEIESRLKEIDSLYKMMSVKDDEIDELKKAYQILKDDIEGHNIIYLDTPEFEEVYISKDKIREKIKELEKEIEEVNENCPDFTIIYEHEVDTYGIINVLKELLGE